VTIDENIYFKCDILIANVILKEKLFDINYNYHITIYNYDYDYYSTNNVYVVLSTNI